MHDTCRFLKIWIPAVLAILCPLSTGFGNDVFTECLASCSAREALLAAGEPIKGDLVKQHVKHLANSSDHQVCVKRSLLNSGQCEKGTATKVCYSPDNSANTVDLHRQKISFISTEDGTTQYAYLIVPEHVTTDETYLVVSLHSWSSDFNQRSDLEKMVFDKGWFYLFPDFRGPNQRPAACGSKLAQQDILDALDFTLKKYSLDSKKVFLTGTSGGGHMAMLMSGLYPQRWRAACSWVGISDLVTWHKKHLGSRYGNMIEKSCGGRPGVSIAVDEEYRMRSPVNWISNANKLPIALFAGIHDGHQGSVPIRQSINAFNALCRQNGDSGITETEAQQLSRKDGRLVQPKPNDEGFDKALGRHYYLHRRSESAQIMIFEGGHECISAGTMDWFERSISQ